MSRRPIARIPLVIEISAREVRRLLKQDDGQDTVEYAFLAVFVGVTSYLVLDGIKQAVGVTYAAWLDPSTSSGVPYHWEPPDPAGGGS